MLNYYEILEIDKTTSQETISNAYSRLSLKYHPKRNEQKDFIYNNMKFSQISEAYDVLSNSYFKGIYDFYGYEGLIHGVKDINGNLQGGYRFNGNPYAIFERYFGTNNPHGLLTNAEFSSDEFGSMLNSGFGGLNYSNNEPPADVIIVVDLSLDEVYNGCFKSIDYEKSVFESSNRVISLKRFIKSTYINKGIKTGDLIIFKGEGNEKGGYVNCK